MPDVFTPAKRSEVMSRIRSTGNAATELRLVALLRAERITGWRRHLSLTLPHARLRSSPTPAPGSVRPAAEGADSAPPKGRSQARGKAKGRAQGSMEQINTQPSEKSPRPDFQSSSLRSSPLSVVPSGVPKERGKPAPAATTPKPPRKRPRVRPDFVFREARLVIFVDGCFWHGCPTHGTRPRQNRKFWDEKIARNRRRDRHVTRALKQQGWTVLRLWECALARKRVARTLSRIKRALAL